MPNFPNRCQHIKVNGTLCGSPALRRNRFCYFHKLHHEERIELNLDRLKNDRARRRKVVMELPVLEDANSIQVSLMQIMRLIVAGQIDGKTAGLLLYALQTASANLPRTTFEPYMHNVVLDLKTVHETPLSAHIWEDSDFSSDEDDDNEEAMLVAAREEANRRARKKIALDRWAEVEADRLAEEGRRQREASRQAAAQKQAADRAAQAPAAVPAAAPAVTPAGRAVLPPAPTEPPPKRPSSNVSMDDVRKKVSEQVRKALPDIIAAQSSREKSRRENGKSSG
jgi:pyruvate/2-oxoglutarate dehydrogenase complex dihydrolipoamide acyltransferase (E2) component